METCLTLQVRYANLNSTETPLPSRLVKIQKFDKSLDWWVLNGKKKAPS